MASRSWLREAFIRERAAFAKRYPHALGAELALDDAECTPHSPCGYRDVAFAQWNRSRSIQRVTILSRALRMPKRNLIAIIRHELGHICDPTPGRRGAEQRADDIAHRVRGAKIHYDARDVQTIGPGKYPRPLHLHQ